eukprot:1149476-Pelagomonas_calceolata.AAC.1
MLEQLGMNAQIKLLSTHQVYQASQGNNLIDTGIHSAGSSGNPFYKIAWLAQGEERPSASESSSPIPNLMYFFQP